MELGRIPAALDDIRTTADPFQKGLKLAGLVTAVFAEHGCELVVAGESAIEIYTAGAYRSSGIDLRVLGVGDLSPRRQQDLLGLLEGMGGYSSWVVAGVRVAIHGRLEESEPGLRLSTRSTPYGNISLVSAEGLIVESVLVWQVPATNRTAREGAKKLIAAAIAGAVDVDWEETERLAGDDRYGVAGALQELVKEVRTENGQ